MSEIIIKPVFHHSNAEITILNHTLSLKRLSFFNSYSEQKTLRGMLILSSSSHSKFYTRIVLQGKSVLKSIQRC